MDGFDVKVARIRCRLTQLELGRLAPDPLDRHFPSGIVEEIFPEIQEELHIVGLREFLRHFRPFHVNFECAFCDKVEWRPTIRFSSGEEIVVPGGYCMGGCSCPICEECVEAEQDAAGMIVERE